MKISDITLGCFYNFNKKKQCKKPNLSEDSLPRTLGQSSSMASFFFLHNSQLQKGFKVTYKNINNTFKTDEEITERKREEHKESQDREMHAIKLTDIY